jgi:hypothetical protein
VDEKSLLPSDGKQPVVPQFEIEPAILLLTQREKA